MAKSSRNRRGSKGLSVYSNLNAQRRTNKDLRSRRRAEYLATLPKHPVKRFFYRLHPKRFFSYWFSREGALMALKVAGVGMLLMLVMFSGLFAYYRRELDAIRPSELAKRVQTTVTKYYDRNGVLLWEDKGDDDYKLVVESEDISDYMKEATIAIEDREFYQHNGFSIVGIGRAAYNNFTGGAVQGGSTLTQQLVKQVFFEDEAGDRSLSGVPRKIKETILAIEVERMYNKDQILALYLNESPYGGRRNGVESAAQTYFGKSAKELGLAESALLASIPQQPGRYDPYNTEGHENLLIRQQTTLDYMANQNYITDEEADKAKEIAILDTIKPESNQFKNIKAPHFVQMVKAELEAELGEKTVGNGGLIVKTTLDWRAQQVVDREVEELFAGPLPVSAGFDNGAVTVVDNATGQVLAMRGSRDFRYPGYGANNAALSYIQPGSSIKPLVYASLFKQQAEENYGAGSVLSDENIDDIVGYDLNNFDNKFRGNIPIRSALAESRNIPAVKAYLIDGREDVLNTIHEMGDTSYCTDGRDSQAGVSLAIGGCGAKQLEHVNAFATLARMGTHKPTASILEVKNSAGQVIQQWKDEGAERALDPQIPYIISDILSDDAARAPSFGMGAAGLNVPGVKTATKTGTSNIGDDSKDLWMMSYTPKATMGIWVGNNTPEPMNNALSSIVGPTVGDIMGPLHTEIFQKDGSWSPDDWFERPDGVQEVSVGGRTDLFPSWFNKDDTNTAGERLTFDRVSKKKATDCTPEAAKIEINVQKVEDPVTDETVYLVPDGYDVNEDDDVHECDDVEPFVSGISRSGNGITASVGKGTHLLEEVEFFVNGSSIGTVSASGTSNYTIDYSGSGTKEVRVIVRDRALYEGALNDELRFPRSGSGSDEGDD